MEEDLETLKVVLKPPKDFKSKGADPNLIDKK